MAIWQVFDAATLLAYLAACVALVATPGPGQALVLARTVQGGARAGVLTAAGLQLGTLVHVVAAALGLTVLLAHSATAFTVIKWVGATYLVWLGVKAWRQAGAPPPPAAATPPPGRRLLWQAALTGTLNPKVALFFLAFLPPFVHPERGAVLLQFAVLGTLLAAMLWIGDSLIALAAARAQARLAANPRARAWRERAAGTVLLALGLRLAFLEQRR